MTRKLVLSYIFIWPITDINIVIKSIWVKGKHKLVSWHKIQKWNSNQQVTSIFNKFIKLIVVHLWLSALVTIFVKFSCAWKQDFNRYDMSIIRILKCIIRYRWTSFYSFVDSFLSRIKFTIEVKEKKEVNFLELTIKR